MDKQENFSPFELAKQLHEEQLADLEKERMDGGEEPKLPEFLEENFDQENLLDEPDFLLEEEQQNAAEQLKNSVKNQMAGQIKQKAAEKIKKKVVSTIWKKVAAWLISLSPGVIIGTIMVVAIFLFVAYALSVKCQIAEQAGIFKPILSLAGISCE